MAFKNTNLIIQGSQLPASFRGKPNDLFREMLARMRIVSPTGTSFFVISDTEPEGDQGPWLKGGTQWWVFDPNLKRYVPLDISESETHWFQVGSTTPTTTTPPVWLKTSDGETQDSPNVGTPIAWYLFDGTNWIQFPVLIEDRTITASKLAFLANFFGTASGFNDYTITFVPGTGFSLGDGSSTTFAFLVKFSNANTDAVRLNVNGSGFKPVKKFTGQELAAGEILADSIHLIVFEGEHFQLLSAIAPIKPGQVLGSAVTTTDTTDNTTLVFPYDNTIPQNTEGEAFNDLETVFTAQRAGSTLIIDLRLSVSTDDGTDVVVALFRDSEPSALGLSLVSILATESDQATLRVVLQGVDALPHTYRVRFGSTRTGTPTVYINSTSDGTNFGGMSSSLTITEVSA